MLKEKINFKIVDGSTDFKTIYNMRKDCNLIIVKVDSPTHTYVRFHDDTYMVAYRILLEELNKNITKFKIKSLSIKEGWSYETIVDYTADREEDFDIGEFKKVLEEVGDKLKEEALEIVRANLDILHREIDRPPKFSTFCESLENILLGKIKPGRYYTKPATEDSDFMGGGYSKVD